MVDGYMQIDQSKKHAFYLKFIINHIKAGL